MLRFARSGEHAAITELVERHLFGLKRYLYFLCSNDSIAEELAQEVWIRIIRARAKYEPKAKFRTYLFTVAHHYFIDEYRKTRSGPEIVSNATEAMAEEVAQIPSTDEPMDEWYARQRTQERLTAAIMQLPEAQRSVLLLYGEGYTLEEIADVTGKVFETVKSQLRYAKDKLRSFDLGDF